MASINEVITRVDNLRENKLAASVKAAWLLELEGRLYETVIASHEGYEDVERVTKWPEEGDEALMLASPWSELYTLYLLYRLDDNRRERDNAKESYAAYAGLLEEWKCKYHRDHIPLGDQVSKNFL